MSFDFRSYNSAVEDLLGAAAWAELGEEESLGALVERVREKHQELADAGAMPAVVFIRAVARVTDRSALEGHLRETDRLSEPAEGTETTEASLARDALFSAVEYKREEEPPVWIAGISRHSVTEDGQLMVEGRSRWTRWASARTARSAIWHASSPRPSASSPRRHRGSSSWR
jgi:N-dimethylarginine dimethylaminohydrolase